MACVVKRRGKWTLDYRDQHGRRHWETTDGNRKDAELLLAKRLQEVSRGEYQPEREQRTFADLAGAYTESHIRVNVRQSTAKDYEGLLRRHLLPYFGSLKLQSLTVELVERFRGDHADRIGRRTTNKCLTLLSAMFRYAERHRLVPSNPVRHVAKLRDEATRNQEQIEGNILHPAEIQKLLAATDERWRPLLMTAVLTGLRQGELLGLQWGDIDWQARQIHVRRSFSAGRFYEPKTRYSRRRVDMPGVLVSELKRWKLACPPGDLDLVFPSGAGNPENPSNVINRGLNPALRRAGLRKIRFHDLRHCYASLLIHNNESPKRIQSLLGHSSIKVTFDIYGHLLTDGNDGVADRLADLALGSRTVAEADTESG
jgi:integrase